MNMLLQGLDTVPEELLLALSDCLIVDICDATLDQQCQLWSVFPKQIIEICIAFGTKALLTQLTKPVDVELSSEISHGAALEVERKHL